MTKRLNEALDNIERASSIKSVRLQGGMSVGGTSFQSAAIDRDGVTALEWSSYGIRIEIAGKNGAPARHVVVPYPNIQFIELG